MFAPQLMGRIRFLHHTNAPLKWRYPMRKAYREIPDDPHLKINHENI